VIDLAKRAELAKEVPDILRCYQCGSCVATCPAQKYGGSYSPRKKILSALRGEETVLGKELFRCLTCHSCNERCPQGVNPYDVIVKLKNYAVRTGIVDETYKKASSTVLETGRALPVTERCSSQRAALGLKELKDRRLDL